MRYQELEGKTQMVAQDAEALNALSREMDNIRSSYDSDRRIWVTLEQSYIIFPSFSISCIFSIPLLPALLSLFPLPYPALSLLHFCFPFRFTFVPP